MTFPSEYYLVDIDGTLTDYRPGAVAPEKLLHGNFLFPLFRDLMVEQGWEPEAAGAAIREAAERIVYWDYPDFIAEFDLPAEEAFRRMAAWHLNNLVPCDDGVALVKKLAGAGKQLFIMSNNPHVGCLLKLQAAGLTDDKFASPYFREVFGTNLLRGCKNSPEVWKRALARLPASPAEVGVIGDNPKEDGDIPRSCGIVDTILLPRETAARGAEAP